MEQPPDPVGAVHARRLEVPRADWGSVRAGQKTEFRVAGGRLLPNHVVCPQPVIAWARGRRESRREMLLVLEACWTEPLGSIGPDSLGREGFDSLDEFRAYWRGRAGRFRPLDKVVCYRVHPFDPDDRDEWADRIFDRLFGHVLEGSRA